VYKDTGFMDLSAPPIIFPGMADRVSGNISGTWATPTSIERPSPVRGCTARTEVSGEA
jgi:hypothetical protein